MGDAEADGPSSRARGSRRHGWLLWVIVGLALSVCLGVPQGILYVASPPYLWKGWVDGDRRVPPPWQAQVPVDNGFDAYRAIDPLLPATESEHALLVRVARAADGSIPDDLGADRQRARVLVCAHKAVLAKLREAADKECASGTAPGAPDPSRGPMYWPAARFAAAAAGLDHLEARDDDALRTLQDTMAMGVNLNSGESYPQALGGISCVALADQVATVILRSGQPSPDALRAHARRMRELRLRLPGLRRTMCYEAARADAQMESWEFMGPRELRRDYQALKSVESDASGTQYILAQVKAGSTREWLQDRYARLVDEVDRPPRASQYAAMWGQAQADAAARHDSTAAEMLFWVNPGVLATYRSMVGQLAAEEIIAALELCKREHGAYPAGLQELVPAYLADVPVDPFTDDPMVYRPVHGGYVLYGLGPNMADDGGVSALRGGYEPDQVFVDDAAAGQGHAVGSGPGATGP
jgi:hypothetical protein